MKDIKVLIINPAIGMDGFLYIGISSLIAVLKNNGFDVDLFDTTYYKTTSYDDRKKNERVGEYLPVDMSKYGVEKMERDYIEDMNIKIKAFNPNLIAVSIVTAFNFPLARTLLNSIRDYDGIVIVGGKFPTVSPDKCLNIPRVDIVCIGEGEKPLLELCMRLENKKPYDDIKSLWIKKNDVMIRNELMPLEENLDNLPYPNWDLYDKRHFYRPFCGKVYRYGHVELSRGCPYHCSYCINHKLQQMYKGKGKYYRRKSIPRIIEEIKYLKEKYNLEIIKFWDEEFLLLSEKELKEFAEAYKQFNLPFLMDTRLDSVTENKAKILKDMGCVNVSAGVECGSEKLRKEVLDRSMTNEEIVEGIRILNKYNIRTSTLNMIGIPFETRKDILKTIEINRKAHAQNSSVLILQPWDGTKIRDVAVKAGFMDVNCENYNYTNSFLDMPQLSKEEIAGLAKTFTLYRKVPKILYPLVKICEKDGKWRDKIFMRLHQMFKSN